MRQCYRRSPHRQGVLGSTLFVGVIGFGSGFDNCGAGPYQGDYTFGTDGSYLLVAAAVGDGASRGSRGCAVVGNAFGKEELFVAANFVESYSYSLFTALEFIEGDFTLFGAITSKSPLV